MKQNIFESQLRSDERVYWQGSNEGQKKTTRKRNIRKIVAGVIIALLTAAVLFLAQWMASQISFDHVSMLEVLAGDKRLLSIVIFGCFLALVLILWGIYGYVNKKSYEDKYAVTDQRVLVFSVLSHHTGNGYMGFPYSKLALSASEKKQYRVRMENDKIIFTEFKSDILLYEWDIPDAEEVMRLIEQLSAQALNSAERTVYEKDSIPNQYRERLYYGTQKIYWKGECMSGLELASAVGAVLILGTVILTASFILPSLTETPNQLVMCIPFGAMALLVLGLTLRKPIIQLTEKAICIISDQSINVLRKKNGQEIIRLPLHGDSTIRVSGGKLYIHTPNYRVSSGNHHRYKPTQIVLRNMTDQDMEDAVRALNAAIRNL